MEKEEKKKEERRGEERERIGLILADSQKTVVTMVLSSLDCLLTGVSLSQLEVHLEQER